MKSKTFYLSLCLALISLFAFLQVNFAIAQSGPTLENAIFFGGSGDQKGTGITVSNNLVYISGIDNQSAEALVLIYGLTPVSPLWSTNWPGVYRWDEFRGLAATNEGIYLAGTSYSQTIDGCGGKEGKGVVVKFPPNGGGPIWMNAQNFFPYRGGETFRDAATDGTAYVYAVGDGESYGWGPRAVVLVKYDFSGNVLNRVTEPGLTLGFNPCFHYQSVGQSDSQRILVHNGKIYICGKSRLWVLGEDNVLRPFISQFDPGLVRQWKRRPADLGAGIFHGLAGHGNAVYAVGTTYTPNVPGTKDYLIQKYDESGTLLWSQNWGGTNDDFLTGVAIIDDRLFAVGGTRSEGMGGADVVIFELDPSTGAILCSSLFGGAQDDFANDVATNGENLYVVGESRSFSSPEGNAADQNDVLLLHYSIGPFEVEIDIKPGAYPNSINLGSQGNVPVVIFSTAHFDATAVDPITVTLAGASVKIKGKGTPMASFEDVNGDGLQDIIVHVDTTALQLSAANTEAVVEGETYDGQKIRGVDTVRIVQE